MNVRDTSSHGDTLIQLNMVSQCQTIKMLWAGHETCQKLYKFDLEVKVQGRIWILNVRDTSSHGDTSMCQIW